MSYKRGMSKSKYKAHMKLFWTRRWRYEKSPEEWVELINNRRGGAEALRLVQDAVEKLILEKQVSKEQGVNLQNMLKSPDEENNLVALTIMATLKPKKFKRIKNTETNNERKDN